MAFSLAWISFSWFWYMFSWWLSLAYFSLISVSSTTPNASSAHACIEIKDVLGHQETALHLLRGNSTPTKFAHNIKKIRLQNSPYSCVFKYAWAVKQKVWNEAENRERDWGETLKICFFFSQGRVRLVRFALGRLLRHALPISLLILRKIPTVLQSKKNTINVF